MILHRRRKGSQRLKAPLKVEFHPNWAGQDGHADLVIVGEHEYFILTFESEAEVKQLLSQAHIVHHNYGETR